MRTRNVLMFAVSFVFAAAVLAQSAKPPVHTPAADLKWTDLDPARAPGVKIADLWGNHATGPYSAFIKFPAGFSSPLHTHPHDVKIVVVSGTFVQAPEGKPEVRLGPGSYLMQPGANYRHTTRCEEASECLFFVESQGAFGLIPAEAAKAPAAK